MGHFLEAAGVPTTGISLVREHTAALRAPRFLWVPFPLGRPFGAPGARDFQRRVLHRALALLERRDGPVVLEDFEEDAPATRDDAGEAWSCPVDLAPPDTASMADPVAAVRAELERLARWHAQYVAKRGRAAPPNGPPRDAFLSHMQVLLDGKDPGEVNGLPLHEWVRLGCDDLRTWCLEAAQGQPGQATPQELQDWFWRETAAARLIGAAAEVLRHSENPLARALAARAMVPREYQEGSRA